MDLLQQEALLIVQPEHTQTQGPRLVIAKPEHWQLPVIARPEQPQQLVARLALVQELAPLEFPVNSNVPRHVRGRITGCLTL
jgi:hypothetical protein